MRTKIQKYFFGTLVLGMAMMIGCSPKGTSDQNNLTGLLFGTRATPTGTVTGTRAQVRQASAGRTAGTSSASAARGAARTGFFIPKHQRMNKRLVGTWIMDNYLGSTRPGWAENRPYGSLRTILTSVTCTSGGAACTAESTDVEFSGASACAKGGTSTLSKLASSLSGATLDSLVLNMTGGSVSFNKCVNEATDFANYPAKTRVNIESGSIEPRGSYSFADESTAETLQKKTVEDLTVNSTGDGVKIAGTDIKIEELRSVTTLTETDTLADSAFLDDKGEKLTFPSSSKRGKKASAKKMKKKSLGKEEDADGDGVADLDADGDGTPDALEDPNEEESADENPEFLKKIYGFGGTTTANGTLVLTGKIGGSDVGSTLTLTDKKIKWKFLCTKSFADMTDDDWASESTCTFTSE